MINTKTNIIKTHPKTARSEDREGRNMWTRNVKKKKKNNKEKSQENSRNKTGKKKMTKTRKKKYKKTNEDRKTKAIKQKDK